MKIKIFSQLHFVESSANGPDGIALADWQREGWFGFIGVARPPIFWLRQVVGFAQKF